MQENININAYEMAKQMAGQAPIVEIEGEVESSLRGSIKRVVMGTAGGETYVLMSPQFKYLTIFRRENETGTAVFTEGILNFIKEEVATLGGFKGSQWIPEQEALEIWVGDNLYMLFNYDYAVEII